MELRELRSAGHTNAPRAGKLKVRLLRGSGKKSEEHNRRTYLGESVNRFKVDFDFVDTFDSFGIELDDLEVRLRVWSERVGRH